jgi:hypothetical protein
MMGIDYAMNNQSDNESYLTSQMDSRVGLKKGESFRTTDLDRSNQQLQIAKDKHGLKK